MKKLIIRRKVVEAKDTAVINEIKKLTLDIAEQKSYLAHPATKKKPHYQSEVEQLKDMEEELRKLKLK